MRASISEWIFLIGGQGMSDQNFSKQQITVHGIADDLGNFRISELNEGVSFGPCRLLRAGSFHAQNIAILTEVGFELFFEESMRQMAHIDNSVLN